MVDVLVREMGLDFDIIRGVSVGALNAAFLAQAPKSGDSLANLRKANDDLVRIWTHEIQGNASVYMERVAGFPGLAAGADSILDNEPLWSLIQKFIDVNKLRTSQRDFAVGVASLVSGNYVEMTPDAQGFLKLVLASTAIPVIFPPVWRKAARDVLVDGGVREITPLSMAFRAKPDEIYVLMTSRATKTPEGDLPSNTTMPSDYEEWDDNFIGTKVNGIDVLTRTVEILTDEIYLDDVRGALEWNAVLQGATDMLAAASGVAGQPTLTQAAQAFQATLASTKKSYVPIHVLAPCQWYGKTNSATAFDPKLLADAIEHGRQIARDRTKWLWP
jgi:NTE family protein